MGLFGTIGSVGGALLGNALVPGIGGYAVGGAMGGLLGSALDPQASNGGGLSEGERARMDQIRQQQALLADQLRLQASGGGPNPAAIQAQRAGNRAIQQNAGFIASQKGMNPALAQRLAAQNQAMMGQEIAGKSAEVTAQQQIAAQGQLAGLLGGQANADLKNKELAQQLQMSTDQRNSNIFGGLINAGGAAGTAYLLNQPKAVTPSTMSTQSLPQWESGGYSADNFGAQPTSGGYQPDSGGNLNPNQYSLGGEGITVQGYAQGGKVPEFSGSRFYGEQFTGQQQPDNTDEQFKQYLLRLKEEKLMKGKNYSEGGPVAGKQVVAGNSPKNDTVPAMLSAGEIVIPKSAAKSPDLAKEFIDHVMKSQGSQEIGYHDIMQKQIELQKKIAKLEKKVKG